MQTGGHTFETFSTNFHVILANLITEGKITQEYVNELKKFFGLDEIWKVNDEQKQMLFDQWIEYKFITKA